MSRWPATRASDCDSLHPNYICYAHILRNSFMNALSPSELLTYNTLRLECTLKDGGTSTGTAFRFDFLKNEQSRVPVFVTNIHVVKGAETGTFVLHLADTEGGPRKGLGPSITLDQFEERWIPHPDTTVDLCVMPCAPLLQEACNRNMDIFDISLDKSLILSHDDLENLTAIEEIIMIGYPVGIWDYHNNFPITRR